MSKSDGLKIGIKFTEDIVGIPSLQGTLEEKQDGEWTANGTYSGTIDSVKDGSISTYWQSRSVDNHIQINRPNTKLLGFKIYKGSSYRPSDYTISVSKDGVDYINVVSGSLTSTTGWETIIFRSHLEYGYFRFNFGYSSRLYLYELVLIVDECEFMITGQEHKYINGQLEASSYTVTNIERHPTEPKSILLTLDWWGKFNNVVGDLTVSYDETKGNLQGAGGAVESFEVSFTPEDLVPTPNPGIEEYISVAPSIAVDFNPLEFLKAYENESDTITVSPVTVTATLTDVSIINP